MRYLRLSSRGRTSYIRRDQHCAPPLDFRKTIRSEALGSGAISTDVAMQNRLYQGSPTLLASSRPPGDHRIRGSSGAARYLRLSRGKTSYIRVDQHCATPVDFRRPIGSEARAESCDIHAYQRETEQVASELINIARRQSTPVKPSDPRVDRRGAILTLFVAGQNKLYQSRSTLRASSRLP